MLVFYYEAPWKVIMTWFEELLGFREESPENVRRNVSIEGDTLVSYVNSARLNHGRLETPSLGELRRRVEAIRKSNHSLTVREVVSDVQELHQDEANAGSLMQVASQFNLLEMTSPRIRPEDGITRYESDRTQGPACAIAAGAGTVYRNYFVPINGELGQREENQIDCLADMGKALGNASENLWEMQNGYALASKDGLADIESQIEALDEAGSNELRGHLRVGVLWHTQVTLPGAHHHLAQVYCSALPVAYSNHEAIRWRSFAKLILEASYEATMCLAALNAHENHNRTVYLTMLGGGAFGNKREWITDAITRSLAIFKDFDLDVGIVSYGHSNDDIQDLVARFRGMQEGD
jgi:hypothetical protein